MGSERKSWNCSGMSLPNKCKSSAQGEALIGHKRWICETCHFQFCYKCLKRTDIIEVCENSQVHPHFLYKGKFKDFFKPYESVICECGEKDVGITHEIDPEQNVLRCEPCNFNCCEECFDLVRQNLRDEAQHDLERSMIHEDIAHASRDKIFLVSTHKHPLIKVIDENALCSNVLKNSCISLTNKSNKTEPLYFKSTEQNSDYILCAL